MNAFFAGLGRFVVRFRWFVLAFWVIMIAVSGSFPSMSSQANGNNSSFLSNASPSQQAAILAEPLIGSLNTSQIQVVVASPSRPLGPADLVAIAALRKQLSQIESVTAVKFVQISQDHHAVELLVFSSTSQFNRTAITNVVNDVAATVSHATLPPGTEAHLAGSLAASIETNSSTKSQNSALEGFSILFILALLFVIFRSALAPFLIIIPSVVASQIAGGFIGLLGSHGLKVSTLATFLLTVLVLGAGVDYGLFLVFRVREEIESGRNHRDAVAESVLRVGESIAASAGTVIVALLTLLFATFGLYHDLAVPLAIGISVMLLAGLTLQPALVAIFGRATFWPTKPKARDHVDGVWGRIAGGLIKKPALTLTVGVVVLAGLASFIFAYQPAGFGGSTTAPAGSDAAAGDALLAQYFPRASTNPTNVIFKYASSVWTDPTVLATTQADLKATGQFTTVVGALNATTAPVTPAELKSVYLTCGPPQHLRPVLAASQLPTGISAPTATTPATCALARTNPALYNAYVATSRYVSSDGRVAQFETGLAAGDASSTAAVNAVPEIRAAVESVASKVGAVQSGVAGAAPAFYDISSVSNSDLHTIVPLAALAIGIILAIVLRSLIAPLYLIASVVLSYLAAVGFAVLVFMKFQGQGGLVFFLPFMLFLFLLALGEDYNILVMTRIREEAAKLPLKDAVIKAIGTTGTTVTSAGLVLAGTFVVFGLVVSSGGSGSAQFEAVAYGLAAGILLDTFVVRTVLVPATVVLLGRWNWWPSKLAEIHDEFHPEVEESAS